MSSVIQRRIKAVREIQKSIIRAEEKLANNRQELAVRMQLLRDEIENKGGTTGDPLRDLVIRAHGLDERAEKIFRILQGKLKGKRGEFVMIRYQAEVRERYGGDLCPTDFRHEAHFRIGVLVAEELCLRSSFFSGSNTITLPVDRYLQGTWPEGFRLTPQIEDREPSQEDFFERHHEDGPPSLVRYLIEDRFATDLLIGDEAVTQAVKATGSEAPLLAIAAEKLGRPIIQRW